MTALSGAISCSLTHSSVVPLDVIKSKMQTQAGTSQRAAAAAVWRAAQRPLRVRAFFTGAGATAMGYFFQGAVKFGPSPPARPLRVPAPSASAPQTPVSTARAHPHRMQAATTSASRCCGTWPSAAALTRASPPRGWR